MTLINRLFSLSLKLYPRQFRARFGAEMEEVFSLGLLDSMKDNRLVGYLAREFLRFPVTLVGVYIWSMQMGEGKQVAVLSVGSGSSGVSMPGEGWRSSLMAGLPHLLIAMMIIGSEILYSISGGNGQIVNIIFLIGISILGLSLIVYSRFKGWKTWSASWLVYIFGISVTLLSLAANALPHNIIKNNNLVYEAQTLVIPLALAYLLYKITCKDRLWGLLAAIPPTVIIWTFSLEFVPSLQKSLAWEWIFILAFTASVLMMRTKTFSIALFLAMAVPVLGGLPFVYLGVYQGGTLPFSEPGPSLVEVIRQYIPFVTVALSIILGPQLAVKLHEAGHIYGKEGGKIFYRLALGGILLGLLFSLLAWITATSGVDFEISTSKGLMVISLVLFLVGYGLLLWTAHRSWPVSSNDSDTLELIALFFPLFFVPLMIILLIPVLTGNFGGSWWVAVGQISWIVASTLVVKN
jgi:hypothetical protein